MSEEMLLDIQSVDVSKIEARDVKVTKSGPALVLASGHRQEWPGITLRSATGRWDLSRFQHLALDVANTGANSVEVHCRVDNPGADGNKNCIVGVIKLKPAEAGTLIVDIVRKPMLKGKTLDFFGMRASPIGGPGEKTIDPANIVQLIVYVPKPKEDHRFEIRNVRAGGAYVEPQVASADDFFPFIDQFGQYIHKDWPGKTHSKDELKARIEEAKELAAKPGPKDWNEYGGWLKGPALKATGFFRAEKHNGQWWLVDPKGRLFFSHGIDCVGAYGWGATPIEEREKWFKDLPPKDGGFAKFYMKHRCIMGHYKDRNPLAFDFIGANLMRKYGADWQVKDAQHTHVRLRSWGLNTIANWSDPVIYLLRKTPYTVAIHFSCKQIEGSEGYWGKFWDVFDASFPRAVREALAKEKGKTAGDPWCIGYFVDNEIAWGDEISLPTGVLLSPASQPAKVAFVNDLKAKYTDIAALNKVWGTSHASWDALLGHRGAPDKEKAAADCKEFYAKLAEQYFQVCRDAVKEVAPNNLYLGCRFAWVNDTAAKVAAKFCDVVSYNLYFRRSVADFKYPGPDVPLIIGEYHFGALDRGLFHPGLMRVLDQADRAAAYKEYVTSVLLHPSFVGCHWFQYRDEPTTGRPLDGENYQCGFIDVADTPYPETINACREIGYQMYEVRLSAGKKPR